MMAFPVGFVVVVFSVFFADYTRFYRDGGPWNSSPQPHSPPEILKFSIVFGQTLIYYQYHPNTISEIRISDVCIIILP